MKNVPFLTIDARYKVIYLWLFSSSLC